MSNIARKLRVFLCHASQDKPIVRELYKKLLSEDWIDPWLDEEKLLPGQDFHLEINKATRDADVIIICLSKAAVVKEGYVNREIRQAIDIAQEKLEGEIYIIPLCLDDCDPSFEQLKKLHRVNYFEDNGYERLKKSLAQRLESLGEKVPPDFGIPNDLYKFVYFPAGQLPETQQFSRYPFWISKYPVTNFQYERFLKSAYFSTPHKGIAHWDVHDYWSNFPFFNEERAESKSTNTHTGNAGWKWLKMMIEDDDPPVFPRYWDDPDFGVTRKNVPVVGVTWYEASAYCKWLEKNWNNLEESKVNKEITVPSQIWMRLPTRNEWEVAAGGKFPNNRFPWDKTKEVTHDIREIFGRANVAYQVGRTSPVDKYKTGASPRGIIDMSGNVWEWLSDVFQSGQDINDFSDLNVEEDDICSYNMIIMKGGSWSRPENDANLSGMNVGMPIEDANDRGFRVVIAKM